MFALKIKAYAESAYHDGRITAVYLFAGGCSSQYLHRAALP